MSNAHCIQMRGSFRAKQAVANVCLSLVVFARHFYSQHTHFILSQTTHSHQDIHSVHCLYVYLLHIWHEWIHLCKSWHTTFSLVISTIDTTACDLFALVMRVTTLHFYQLSLSLSLSLLCWIAFCHPLQIITCTFYWRHWSLWWCLVFYDSMAHFAPSSKYLFYIQESILLHLLSLPYFLSLPLASLCYYFYLPY